MVMLENRNFGHVLATPLDIVISISTHMDSLILLRQQGNSQEIIELDIQATV